MRLILKKLGLLFVLKMLILSVVMLVEGTASVIGFISIITVLDCYGELIMNGQIQVL